MSNETKSNSKENQKRKPYGIEFRPEDRPKLGFEGTTSFTYVDNGVAEPITAYSFGLRVKEVMQALFADCVGCYFETNTKNGFCFSIVFDHDYHDEDEIVGITTDANKTGPVSNSTINAIRSLDYKRVNGNKYVPTQELIDVITPLLTHQAYNNGKPNWNNILVDTVENYKDRQGRICKGVVTKVKNIDINKLWKFIHGDKNEKGESIEWIVSPVHPYAFPQYRSIQFQNLNAQHWHFSVTSINTENARNAFRLFGIDTSESKLIM